MHTLLVLIVMALVFVSPSQAADVTYTVLHRFTTMNAENGYWPLTGLVQDEDGVLYGTTSQGGLSGSNRGTIFKITTDGAFTKLANGTSSPGGLLLGSDGNLYGLLGSIFFRVAPDGSRTILHQFSEAQEGVGTSGLIVGNDGAFYGSASAPINLNTAIIYRLTEEGAFSIAYPTPAIIQNLPSHPEFRIITATTLIQDTNGTFYGHSETSPSIFSLPPGGPPKFILSGFIPPLNITSIFSMMLASDGNLYLTGFYDPTGAERIAGIFQLTPAGAVTLLHSFDFATEGGRTFAPLVEASDGNLYGSTVDGGTNGLGTIYRITPAGALTTLYTFSDGDGYFLTWPMIQGIDGSFYAASINGGGTENRCSGGCGTVFKLDVGLATLEIQITFDNPQPGQTDPLVGQKVIFTPIIGNPAGITRLVWDFGDGSAPQEFTTDNPVEYVYAEVGTFTVSLHIYDSAGALIAFTTKNVTVRCSLDATYEAGIKDKADCDGDEIPNDWEIHGRKDASGNMLLDLPAMGADPLHKDIYVQVDYMQGDTSHRSHQLSTEAIKLVIDAFENANDVPNPDRKTGIRLHVDAGTTHIMNPATGDKWGECTSNDPAEVCSRARGLQEGKYFAVTANPEVVKRSFDMRKGTGLSLGRYRVFHYVISAHFMAEGCQEGIRQGEDIRGLSFNIPNDEFVMTLGNYANQVGSKQEQAVTFMHELGHNLGLYHGGSEGNNINKKPNYLSVMNYSYGHKGGLSVGGSYEKLDYSRFEKSILIETNLDESRGVQNTDIPSNYGILYYCPITMIDSCEIPPNEPTPATASGSIDWNCRDGIETSVSSDINGDGEESTESFQTQNDWKAIKFDGGGIIGNLSGGNRNIDLLVLVAEVEGKFPIPPDYYDPVVVTGPTFWQNFLFPGQRGTLTFSVKNSTPKQAIYTFKVLSPKGWAMTNALPQSIFLQPSEETAVSLPVLVPATARVGEKEQGEFSVMRESAANPGTFILADGASYEVHVVSSDDKDGDGIKNAIDNCPTFPNADQDDHNGNGIGDPCDNIPGGELLGDLDHDGDVDQNDLNILLADRNKPTNQSACGVRCDLDDDGIITALDARKLTLLCTRPRCATK